MNVSSNNDQNKIYLPRLSEKDCQKSIDFLYEKDGNFHYSLIKNFSRLSSKH